MDFLSRSIFRFGIGNEIRFCGPHESGVVEFWFSLLVASGPQDLLYKITRIAGSQGLVKPILQDANEFLHHRDVKSQSSRNTDPAKNLRKLLFCCHANLNLGLNSPQKRGVGEVGRIHVGGEDHQQFKWNFDLFSAHQRKEIKTTVEWDFLAIYHLL